MAYIFIEFFLFPPTCDSSFQFLRATPPNYTRWHKEFANGITSHEEEGMNEHQEDYEVQFQDQLASFGMLGTLYTSSENVYIVQRNPMWQILSIYNSLKST